MRGMLEEATSETKERIGVREGLNATRRVHWAFKWLLVDGSVL